MTTPETLLLTRGDVEALLDMDACIAAVEDGFRAHALGRLAPPGILGFPFPGGGFHIKAAGAGGARAYFAVKINANYPGNPGRSGLPTIQGVVALFDAADGRSLALLDSGSITASRTAAATAVAARYLARPDSKTVTVCGCGVQGPMQLSALRRVLPIERARFHDRDRERADRIAVALRGSLSVEVVDDTELAGALRTSDVVVTCTPSREAYVRSRDVAPGAFVAGVGTDAAEKRELAADLLASSRVVTDVTGQCAEIGDLHHALAEGAMTLEAVHAELGQVVAGIRPGRTSASERFVFDSTGTGLQDAAAAAAAYERAAAAGFGRAVEFAGPD